MKNNIESKVFTWPMPSQGLKQELEVELWRSAAGLFALSHTAWDTVPPRVGWARLHQLTVRTASSQTCPQANLVLVIFQLSLLGS